MYASGNAHALYARRRMGCMWLYDCIGCTLAARGCLPRRRLCASLRVVLLAATMVRRVGVWRALCVSVVAVTVLAAAVHGSVGDRSVQFQRCVSSCRADTCRNHRPVPLSDDTIVPSDPLPWYLVLTGWSCESNCEYHCTHRITNEAYQRVEDIRESVYEQLRAKQEALQEEHVRWKQQLAREAAGIGLEPACEGRAYLNESGYCIPLAATEPEPLLSAAQLQHEAESQIQKKLAWLHPVEKQTVQFYGKWAQLRVMGMQESLSVLFSLMNLAVQVYALRYILRNLVPDAFPLKHAYRRHAQISCVAWLASAVFHTRDVWWTERVDYFCAAAVLLSGLFFAGCRATFTGPGCKAYRGWMYTCIGAWVVHVLYLLSNTRLDYSYNMAACTMVGVVYNGLWLGIVLAPQLFSRVSQFAKKHDDRPSGDDRVRAAHAEPYRAMSRRQQQRLLWLVLLSFCAPGLELFDFPPILRLIDAHALWHLVTVPITLFWYHWLAADAYECVVGAHWRLAQTGHTVVQGERSGAGFPPLTDDEHLPLTHLNVLGNASSSRLPLQPHELERVEDVQRMLVAGYQRGLGVFRSLRAMLIAPP